MLRKCSTKSFSTYCSPISCCQVMKSGQDRSNSRAIDRSTCLSLPKSEAPTRYHARGSPPLQVSFESGLQGRPFLPNRSVGSSLQKPHTESGIDTSSTDACVDSLSGSCISWRRARTQYQKRYRSWSRQQALEELGKFDFGFNNRAPDESTDGNSEQPSLRYT